MSRVKALLAIGLALVAAATSLQAAAPATTFFVYRVKASLPIRQVVIGLIDYDSVFETKLTDKHLVNLALGRALDTKVDSKTEILALATPFEGPIVAPRSKLIVFDPTASGPARIKATVALASAVDLEAAAAKGGTIGQGTASASVQETTLGESAKYALHASSVLLTGAGKLAPEGAPTLDSKPSIKGIVAGHLSFTDTADGATTTIDGYVVNGKISAAGKALGQLFE